MRKWMRDKLKRRKKSSEEIEAKPAPLQPAYFESGPPEAEVEPPMPPKLTPEIEAAPVSEAETDAPRDTASQPGIQSTDNARRPRRRRGRGGRGRKRPGQQAATSTLAGPS